MELGLSAYESKAYAALIQENPLTAYEIARKSLIPTSKIYEVIRKLEQRHMVQAIHGEGSRIFVPASIDEFIQNYTASVDKSLNIIRDEFKDIKKGMDTSYTWHIRDYESLILKTERMLKTAQKTVTLSLWPSELNALRNALLYAQELGVKIGIIHYGATGIKIGTIYQHPIEDTIYERKAIRGFTLVVDSREAVIGKISDGSCEAIWSMNEGFVTTAEDYIRHDIYFLKIARRFAPLLQETFGQRYERLVDIYSDA